MQTAIALNRIADWPTRGGQMRTEQEPHVLRCARENVRLAQENEILRQSYAELTASAERWIRLYESALSRANAAEAAIVSGRG